MLSAHARDMTTEQLGFSVLAAPLAAIDRRALSQAWYSALHLAVEGRSAQLPPKRVVSLSAVSLGTIPSRLPESTGRPTKSTTTAVRRSTTFGPMALPTDRRSARSELAGKIERVFARRATPPGRATLSITGSRSRVHIVLQARGNRIRLIAICHSEVRTVVREALEQARFALAARGIRLDTRVAERVRCS